MPATIDQKAIAWKPWVHGTSNPGYVLGLVEDWLNDFGATLLHDSHPDGWAELDCDRWAFRFDSAGKSIVAIVSIDTDADYDGGSSSGWSDKSRCVRVEIVRGAQP